MPVNTKLARSLLYLSLVRSTRTHISLTFIDSSVSVRDRRRHGPQHIKKISDTECHSSDINVSCRSIMFTSWHCLWGAVAKVRNAQLLVYLH